ncbi:hypothetical protein DSM112329_04734 [Paraconexibacter sp. AEG42_29]|uniref:Uncharacterized protein n=1 Tax=Paraconexibacter sp. AEG42_29 TaxID=2997339 RepID=A0AAU7B1G6_9ACTN
MWIFTTSGFLSVVTPADRPGDLLVRARVRADLEAFCDATGAPAPIETPARDYRWRTFVPAATFATYLAGQAEAIDYGNFKSAVAARQGHDRAHRYHDVWSVMHDLQLADADAV